MKLLLQNIDDVILIKDNFLLAHEIRKEKGFTAFDKHWDFNEQIVAEEIKKRLGK